MKEELKPGSIWTPTKDVETTFPRRVVETTRSNKAPAYDRVSFQRVLKDGAMGVEQSCYVDSWRVWVRQFGAVAGDAPKDKTEALREALVNVRPFVARHLDDGLALACLRQIDAALGK